MTPEQLKILKEEVAKTIKETVNGKIDSMQKGMEAHSALHEQHMVRILPVVEAFEEAQNDLHSAKKAGKLVLWLAATITALGGAILIIQKLLEK